MAATTRRTHCPPDFGAILLIRLLGLCGVLLATAATDAIAQDWTPWHATTNVLSWYDASDLVNVETNDAHARVSAWYDKVSGVHLTMQNTFHQPSIVTNIWVSNVVNVIDFDHTQTFSPCMTNFLYTHTGNIAFFLVARPYAVPWIPKAFLRVLSSGKSMAFGTASSPFILSIDSVGIGADRLTATNGFVSGPNIFNANFDFTSNGIYNMYMNGEQVAADTAYTSKMDYASTVWLSDNFHGMGFEVGELLILTTYTDDLVQKTMGYLAHKWDLLGLLPTDHPYKVEHPKWAEQGMVITIR